MSIAWKLRYEWTHQNRRGKTGNYNIKSKKNLCNTVNAPSDVICIYKKNTR